MKKLLVILVMAILVGTFVIAQDTHTDTQTITITINEIALLAVTGAAASTGQITADASYVTIAVTQPQLAGAAPVVSVVHDPTYLRYTSLRFAGLTRKVTTTFSTIPAGFSISLYAGATDGSAKGNVGAGGTTLEFVGTTLSGDLVTGIGPGLARTGTEANAGHPLTYTADIKETALNDLGKDLPDDDFLDEVETSITVIFTLVDES
ncbi:MAG TPA: hypothetical protein ENN47_09960 [Mesotoga infera]|uniref:Uncharacterized protein n=1 Tax=Mesotoga infera TaxID=1236046 RepID=A0A7C1H7B2_9BACT|nr:hypothetical protein [Mesotoga infera]